MSVSVLEPMGQALQRTGRILFQPFELSKWLTLGFCAFLAGLTEGGWGGGGSNWSNPGGRGGGMPSGPDITNWIQTNLPLILIVGAVVVVVVVLLSALLTWISSRGKFMFIDGLALNRGAVVEPWKAHRALGNSLFAFRFFVGWLFFLLIVAVVAIGLALAWPDFQRGRFGSGSGIALGGGIPLIVVIFLLSFVITFLLEHLVVPAMYLNKVGVLTGWGLVRAEIISGHLGALILFWLMRVVLMTCAITVVMTVFCVTCCISVIPILGAYFLIILTLPVSVFLRCYTLYFLEGFGPQWQFFFENLVVEPPEAAGPTSTPPQQPPNW